MFNLLGMLVHLFVSERRYDADAVYHKGVMVSFDFLIYYHHTMFTLLLSLLQLAFE